jgi:hypothetical protein
MKTESKTSQLTIEVRNPADGTVVSAATGNCPVTAI